LDRIRRSRSTFEMKTNAKKENAPQIAMWRTATAAILCNMSELEQKWAQQPRFLDAAAQSLFGQTETFVQTWQKFQTYTDIGSASSPMPTEGSYVKMRDMTGVFARLPSSLAQCGPAPTSTMHTVCRAGASSLCARAREHPSGLGARALDARRLPHWFAEALACMRGRPGPAGRGRCAPK
jgi:hypothetical protein